MTLVVHTARVSYAGTDRLDVSRKSGDTAFAPSWAILTPVLDARRRWKTEGAAFVDRVVEENLLWHAYCEAYVAEMRASYRAHRTSWDALLARDVTTLCCYCVDPLHCHRHLLAAILAKLGADVRGER